MRWLHARWTQGDFWQSCLMSMWGDFVNLTLCGCEVAKLFSCGCKVTLQISPHMGKVTSHAPHVELSLLPHKSHLTWPFSPCMRKVTSHPLCVPSCWVIHTTTQKSPHMVILTVHKKRHLVPTSHALMSSCPLHHTKVTSHDQSHLVQQSHLASSSHAPLHTKIISFTSCGIIPQKVTQKPRFHP